MSDILEAEKRDISTKGATRSLRAQGYIPAILYGKEEDNLPIFLQNKIVRKKLETGKFFSTVYDLKLAGGKDIKILVRDIQFHPVTGNVLHLDLMRLSQETEITVDVPVYFFNHEECPGLKMGGVLNVVRHTIELISLPDRIPERIDMDLAGAKIGDSLHISRVKLPEGVRPSIEDRDFTVATIAAVRAVIETEEEEKQEETEEEEQE